MIPILRIALLAFLLALSTPSAHAQNFAQRDSLRKRLLTLPNDTNRVLTLARLSFTYRLSKPDTSYRLAQQAYDLARRLDYPKGQAHGLNSMALALRYLGDYPRSLRLHEQARVLYAQVGNRLGEVNALDHISTLYGLQGQWARAMAVEQQAKALSPDGNPGVLSGLGNCYLGLNRLDSAQYYFQRALAVAYPASRSLRGLILYGLGDVALARRQFRAAYDYYQRSLTVLGREQGYAWMYEASFRLSGLFAQTGPADSTRHYARQALTYAQRGSYLPGILKSSQRLAALYKGQDDSQALAYYEIAVAAKDSLFSQEKVKQLLTLDFEEQQKAREIEVAKVEYQTTLRFYALLGGLGALAFVALVLVRTNRQKQKANEVLNGQKEEIDRQRANAENALAELKTTQAQLIQSEKMASLGELTAGIAHEIQNPLNFVNNFSEVSTELVDELVTELDNGDPEEAKAIAVDLKQNLQKITHHGLRASSIVKGMLEHSRNSSGQKEPVDLNALADEYLRLSYHGLRAKDKTFNATLRTDLDPDLPKVELVSQDIGRVLLNLFNNAFYAVQQRSKQAEAGYQPTVTVATRRSGNQVEIRVADNGTGMPQAVRDKIFQPFFTTKPTGQGTGLGLSLSYDIVTKGHGGTLEVQSTEGQGTEFRVSLPERSSVGTPVAQ